MTPDDRFGDLSPDRKALLERRLGKLGGRRDVAGIPRVSRDGQVPLSFAQQRLWFLDQLEPGGAQYNVPSALRVRGGLDLATLRSALAGVVARHETLRTTFTTVDGEPVQVIHPPAPVPLEVTDLSHLDGDKAEAEARALAAAEAARPFDLEGGPLLRTSVLRLGPDDHVLLLTTHHIVSDAWSASVFTRELSALYEGRRLPPLPAQYADFAAWQRDRLSGDVLEDQLDYWRKRLAGLAPVLELPTDRPRPAVRSGRGGTVSFDLDAGVLDALRALGRTQDATPFMTLAAAFQALLSRYSGSDDVAVGTPVAGRSHPDAERLIGFFVNTLVLRTDVSGDPSFGELVRRVRAGALDAYSHQDVPFEKLVEELHPERSSSHTPLFQVVLSLDNTAADGLSLGGTTVTRFPVDYDASKFDITLSMSGDGRGAIGYDADLFEPATIEAMAGHLTNLLEGAAADPARRLSELDVMSAPERHHVVVELNESAAAYPGRCVHELFEARASESPGAVALIADGRELSYDELNRRANRLAHHLAGRGVGPEVPVGICLERGLDFVVAMLAVLKAGGAYLPLDPGYPAERLAFMLEDTGAPLVVTTSALAAHVETPVVLLDADRDALDASAGADLGRAVSPDDLAYVIYTSGSTGAPKGVAVTHGSLVNLVAWHVATYGVASRDRAAHVAPLGFDASVWELWPYLSSGASVALPSENVRTSPSELVAWLNDNAVTIPFLPTALVHEIFSSGQHAALRARTVLTGGEQLHVRPDDATSFELVNHYGPTEATVVASAGPVEAGGGAPPSIGRPIANAAVFVLDPYGNPVPVGVPGELYVGGAGVARGYLARPGLTAERFVPDPFSSVPGARLYRTGDRARHLRDGGIEFLGRMDHQVKIRGFRIEPGEIEAALSTHDAVRDAVVVARDERLVAYVAADGSPTTTELRAHLAAKLPGYMVPAQFVALDELPLTPNGKVDRAALPAPEGRPELEAVYTAPRTPVEEVLAGIWCDVLGLERVGVHDDFFDLGGHSLVATQVVSRARAALSVELPLKALFESPTVAGLAAIAIGSEHLDVPAIEPVPRGSELPLSFAQQRLWFLDRLEPGGAEYNVPLALRVRGPLDLAALRRALAGVVARHETLRTTFRTVDGEPVQVVHAPREVDLDVTEVEDETEARALATAEAERPFDLERGPLLRARVLRWDDDEHVLVVVTHHIVSDGWSAAVFTRELTALYEDPGARLPELSIQYADFAAWQRRWLSGDALEAQLDYWRKRLAGLPPVLELPADHPRPAVRSSLGKTHSFAVDGDTVRALNAVARARNATLFMTLAAAFQTVLSRYSGSDDVPIGTVIAGRTRPEVEDLVGFFVNTLVLRTDLSGDPAFGELLDRVREVALGAYAHQDVPFEKLVEELGPERSLSHTPLFQVMFALQGAGAEEAHALGDAEVTPFALDVTTAKFDLTLSMVEDAAGAAGVIAYSSDLFEPATIERMAGHLTNLLEAVAADPDRPLSELDVMSAPERRHVVVELNDTAAEYPADRCVNELFEAEVIRNPAAVALISDGHVLSYGELNRRANRLAHHLRAKGVAAETPVGICLDRGVDFVVAALAVLKAGGAYVPLDTGYPVERLAFMVEDTGAPVVVTTAALAPRTEGVDVVSLDADEDVVATRPDTNLGRTASPDDLAYVIYTSGSTGTPKGVAVTHRSLTNLVAWHVATYRVAPGDRAAHVAPLGFDASVWELWPYLSCGASLALPPEHVRTSPAELVAWTNDNGVTITFVPTALVHELFSQGLHALLRARTVLTGGDRLRIRPDEDTPFELFNHYGPTEGAVVATAGRVGAAGAAPPSIGRPIANAAVYVLDPRGDPVPIGVPGELFVGGAGVARGYLGRPALTADRFVPDPFSDAAGARLYRTGDRARFLPDGAVEFLGRVDHQVKVRGFRIEPGEIEAALATHEGIGGAVVVSREERLVAYVTPRHAPTATELRAHLGKTLPEHMLPAYFVALDELPLTPNGKVDRAALPAPDGRPELDAAYVPPRTHAEELLAAIWCDVLGLERIGVHDNFFELGGDSILSIQIVARASSAGLGLTPRLLFQHQTVAGLAAVAGERREVAAEQGPVTGSVPLTPIQRWFFERALPDPHHFNQSTLLTADGTDPDLVSKALAALVDHHDALRLRFEATENGWLQTNARVEDTGFFAVIDGDMARVTAAMQASLDLGSGPLLRAGYFDLGEGRARLFLCIHHLAVDAVSWRILLEDLETAYDQLSRGEEIALGSKTTSFRQWSERLAAYASSDDALAEAGYWAETADASLELPVDFDRGPNDVVSADEVTVSLTAAETEGLLHDVPAAYRTQVNDVLLAALARTVSAWAGSTRVVVDLEGHGREDVFDDVDLTRTVGWFTSLFPLALEVESTEPSRLLKSTKERLRAVPRRGLGYGVLRYLAADDVRDRVVARAPLSFNYLGRFARETTNGRFSRAPERTGPDHAPTGERDHLVEVNGSISRGALQMVWTYSRNRHERATIERVAADFVAALRELVAHCRSNVAGGVTPSDFPLASLDQGALDELWDRGVLDGSTQDVYPLTPLQQGMVFHTLYEPGSPVYFQQLCLELTGRLDVDAFEQAWRELGARHEVLRSAVVWEGLAEPVHVIRREADPPLETHDWSGLDERDRNRRLDAYLAADRARGFDLTKAPLTRLALISTGAESSLVVWSFHHVLLDGWSLPLVLGELLARYRALMQGEPLAVRAAPSYRDYVAWLRGRDEDADERYWRETLAGFSAPTSIPARSDTGDRGYGKQTATLSRETTVALESLARRRRVTLSTVVQGAWALLLSRYGGGDDVVFGATVSGRPAELPGVQDTVGLFINTIPVRVSIDGSLGVAPWLERLQSDAIARGPFEHSALTDVHSWSEVSAATPLFESIVVFENYPTSGLDAPGGPGGPEVRVAGFTERTNYPLNLVVAPGRTMTFALDYDRIRFDPATIEQLAGHLTNLLEGMAADPARPVSELEALTPSERDHLVAELNDTAADYPEDRCVHELFEARVRAHPDSLALSFGDDGLSYRELDAAANRLAHHLAGKGVGPEVRVGVCLERSPDLVVSLLAVLKAGGAYVPLDPGYPPDRLAFMLEDTGAPVVVTTSGLAGRLGERGVDVVPLDTDRDVIAARPDDDLGKTAAPDDLAYVIYTSGSTGAPKGVAVPHRGVVNYLTWCVRNYDLGPDRPVPLHTSPSFDLTVTSLLAPLAAGAPIRILPESRGETALQEELAAGAELGPTKLTPAHLTYLTRVLEPEVIARCTRCLVVGGEALTARAAAQWLEHSDSRLINEYGPTEAVVGCTTYEVTDADLGAATVPIGRPISNTAVYVLDAYGNPVPKGAPGELYVGGAGVARGYLDRPAPTAERFVPDPFSSVGGARLYRTGDRVRYRVDGNLEFLGRVDDQLKVRGWRVEPGEVEAALTTHEAVRAAVVVASGERLVAYVVAPAAPTTTELRAHLEQTLPAYMIPANFVVLDELPLTPNGKVDRAALPAPEGRPDLEDAYVAPRTPAEDVLAGIWRDVLRLERVGVHDDFFELGGHSLVATQVVSRTRAAFSVDVPLRALFDTPTVAGLAAEIERILLEEVEALSESDASAALRALSGDETT